MKKLVERSCEDFAAVLASKESVPGGGGAAALVGALGVALCSMVGNFTVGKKKYAAVEADIKTILQKAAELQTRLLELVDEDARAFAPLSKAYSIPKDDPDRNAVLESATLNACKAPMEMVSCCCEVIDLLEEMLNKGSVMLISDVGCGALCAGAALESAAMNVFINTGTLRDRKQAGEMERRLDAVVGKYRQKAAEIASEVQSRIRKEV